MVRVAPDLVGPVGSEVRIMIRPEEIELLHDCRPGPGAVIPVLVRERIFLGDTVTYEVTTRDGQNIVIREPLTRKVGLSHGPGTDAFMHIAPNQHRVYAAT